MINEDEAKKIVLNYLSKRQIMTVSRQVKDEELIIDDSKKPKEYGFIYLICSQKYAETQDINDLPLGLGPIIVLKETGEVIELGTSELPNDAIIEFEINNGFRKLNLLNWLKYKIGGKFQV